MRRGATDEQVRKLAGLNILRVWKQNEIVSSEIQGEIDSRPVESYWEGRTQPTWDGPLPSLIKQI
jgi:membrane dipeptidase